MKRVAIFFLLILVSCQKDYYLDDLNDALAKIQNLESERSTLLNRIEQLNQDKLQLENQKSQLNIKINNLESLVNDKSNQIAYLSELYQNSIEEINSLNISINKLYQDYNQGLIRIQELENSYNTLYTAYLNGLTQIDELEKLNEDIKNENLNLKSIKDELNGLVLNLSDLLKIQEAKDTGITDGYYYVKGYSLVENDSIIWENVIDKTTTPPFLLPIIKVENGEIIADYQIDWAPSFWNGYDNNNEFDYLKYRKYYVRDYTYKSKFGTNSYINEYTGDSIPYAANLIVHDKDIFTWDLVYPLTTSVQTKSIYKNVAYKLFTNEYEFIDGVIYPPVVTVEESSVFNRHSSFDEIKNIYDYYSESNFMSDSIYAEIDQSDPKSYLEAFIKDAKRNGVDLSNINPEELQVEPWYTSTDQSGRNITAWGSINCSETVNRIGYDNSWFESSYLTDNRFNKLYLMYHEFGHTVLGLRHTCAKNHIMYSNSTLSPCQGEAVDEFSYYDNINEFKRAVKNMFEGYNQYYYQCYLTNNIINSINNPE